MCTNINVGIVYRSMANSLRRKENKLACAASGATHRLEKLVSRTLEKMDLLDVQRVPLDLSFNQNLGDITKEIVPRRKTNILDRMWHGRLSVLLWVSLFHKTISDLINASGGKTKILTLSWFSVACKKKAIRTWYETHWTHLLGFLSSQSSLAINFIVLFITGWNLSPSVSGYSRLES